MSAKDRLLARCATVVAVLATLAAIDLHWISFTHAGGLWRDEVGITNIATLPSVEAVWQAIPHDQSPILFSGVIRLWVAIFGGADLALRGLGLTIGLLLMASLWIAGRAMWRGLPLLSLTLFGLNAVVIRYGDTIRSYGLGTACIVVTTALIWRFVQEPTRFRWISAAVAATVSVQTLYQDAFLVLALCVAGCAVFLKRRQRGNGLMTLSIGLPPALSLIPYIRPLLASQRWWAVEKAGISLPLAWRSIVHIAGYPTLEFRFIWMGLLASAVLLGMERALVAHTHDVAEAAELGLFAGSALLVGMVGFGFFLHVAQLPPQMWYFLLPMGFAVVCCEAVLSRASFWIRVAVLGLAVVVGFLAWSVGVRGLEFRQTDGDIVAAQVSREASRDDLIIVNPWSYGITFNRYYRGAAPWTTLPGLEDYRYHRYDLLKLKLEMLHAARPVLDRVAATLQSGHRVWIVGWVPVTPPSKEPPPDLPPAPHGPEGWFDPPYTQSWGAQLYYLLASGAQTVARVPLATKDRINPFENMGLSVASGWRAPGEKPALGGRTQSVKLQTRDISKSAQVRNGEAASPLKK
jgi:hypothetical protein